MPQIKDGDCQNVSKTPPNYMLSTRNPLRMDTHRLKVKGWRKTYHANTSQKKAEQAYFRQSSLQSKKRYQG